MVMTMVRSTKPGAGSGIDADEPEHFSDLGRRQVAVGRRRGRRRRHRRMTPVTQSTPNKLRRKNLHRSRYFFFDQIFFQGQGRRKKPLFCLLYLFT
jgi:hypothetical protein